MQKNIENISSARVDRQAVDLLEDMLEAARNGALRSLMFVELHHDGTISYGWTGSPTDRMVAAIERVKLVYLTDDM